MQAFRANVKQVRVRVHPGHAGTGIPVCTCSAYVRLQYTMLHFLSVPLLFPLLRGRVGQGTESCIIRSGAIGGAVECRSDVVVSHSMHVFVFRSR